MPRCFINTLRNYSGRLYQEPEDVQKNHHRTVTRSGRKYAKPALPNIAKSLQIGRSRSRNDLDDLNNSPRCILQASPKFKYRQKCHPWSQLSVVTRFYLGRQYPELDVSGLKPHERPVWPQDFPCRWLNEDYSFRNDMVVSPFSESDDSECSQHSDYSRGSPNHFCPISPHSNRMKTSFTNQAKELAALNLNPGRSSSKNSLMFGPLNLSPSMKDFKLSEVRSMTSSDGRILAKVFTMKPHVFSDNNTATESHMKKRMMSIQLPMSNKTGLGSPGLSGSGRDIRLFRGDNSIWNKPHSSSAVGMTKSRSATSIEKYTNISTKCNHGTVDLSSVQVKEKEFESDEETFADNSVSHPAFKILSTEKIHRNDRHFKCAECGRVFTVLTALTSHMRTHARQRNKCVECGKVFTRSWLLKGHMRTHTGERPFLCPEPGCDKAFADKSNLRSHLLIHTVTTKSFVCQKCGRAFAQKRYLHKHMLEVCRLVPENQ